MSHGIHREERSGPGKRAAIALSVVLVLLLGLFGAGAYLWSQFGDRLSLAMGWTTNDFEGSGHGEVLVTIEPGDIGEDVARTLADAGVVKTSQAFYELLLQQPAPVEFHPGAYQLKREMSSQAALDALQDPANKVEYRVTIPEGRTAEQTIKTLAEALPVSLEDLEASIANPQAFGVPEGVDSIEGWLYPATYEFQPGMTADDVIAKLVSTQIEALDELGVAPEDRQRVLTIASIVQREAGTAADFAKVSRVIYNRLDIDMPLGMDSTAQYGFGQHEDGSVWSSNEALEDDNPWNTYIHVGLPYGPIASPGWQALEATMYPAEGDWLYFVAINLDTGESAFSVTQEEHEYATEQLHEWCAENPHANC